MSQAYVNKTLDVNLSQTKIEDQLALSMGISNFERPHCLQNKIILSVKKKNFWFKDVMFLLCFWQRNLITVSLGPCVLTCIKTEILLSKLIFEPLCGTQPRYIWFNLELDRSVQSDPNHNHQKKKSSGFSSARI